MKQPRSGFTLIELCLAIAIALVMLMIAVPSVSTFLKNEQSNKPFETFDQMVKKAQNLSLTERRTYVIDLDEKEIVLKPQAPENESESSGIDRIAVSDDENYTFELPAALQKKHTTEWTFWPSGTREPATIYYKGPSGSWMAIYHPLTVKAEVTEL